MQEILIYSSISKKILNGFYAKMLSFGADALLIYLLPDTYIRMYLRAITVQRNQKY